MRPPPPELVSFIDSLPEPHIVCDRNYRVLAANEAYRRSYGADGDFAGRTCYEISHRFAVPCDQAGETCPLKQSLASGQRERVLHLHHTPGGEAYVNIELSPLRDAHQRIMWFVEKMEPLAVARGLSHAQGLVGRSPAFQHMLALVSRVAPSEATVLLLGESGTGKELVARAIHDASRRADRPFVAVDCSGLPETLFESEIFGHEKGAFTGATTRHAGLVEAARGGTLFLDEVGDIPLGMQVKLLRLLETGAFRSVGSVEPRQADIRLVSATHRDLRRMVAAGTFRQDLYFRLNTFPVELPPLRARQADIPLLARSLIARVAPDRPLEIDDDALAALAAYPFPGNVRELRNILERATLFCDGDTVLPEHLPAEVFQRAPWSPDRETGGPGTDEAVLAALGGHRGNRKALARRLGVSERTLYRRIRALRATGQLPD
ncbi:MAG TPA: sigma 54-interacting transcriptional regulator [Rhodocyclaceae bacterium]|nr:sigma 54-interacting transcriptional regulator [Rhodocyclaceae bacterium]HNH35310.1 sigma 54-interacting transcriptional regulator [Rhodocyclaceae bacterium]